MAETLHEMAVRMVGDRCTLGCAGCPAKALWDKDDICLMRLMSKAKNCEEQIEGLRAWAEEHPVPRYPTWKEWQNTVFRYAALQVRPCHFMDKLTLQCGGNTSEECLTCYEHPIPADIAAKLGIRPMEEG